MISGVGELSSLARTDSLVRWVGSVECMNATRLATKLNVSALFMFCSMFLEFCHPLASWCESISASSLLMVLGSLCLIWLVLFFFDFNDLPWWKYHVSPSWSIMPCLGRGIESVRNKVALALCLSQGYVMDGERPSDVGVDVGSYGRMSNDIA